MIDRNTKFIFMKKFKSIVHRYHLELKYKSLVFFLLLKKDFLKFLFQLHDFLELFYSLNCWDLLYYCCICLVLYNFRGKSRKLSYQAILGPKWSILFFLSTDHRTCHLTKNELLSVIPISMPSVYWTVCFISTPPIYRIILSSGCLKDETNPKCIYFE